MPRFQFQLRNPKQVRQAGVVQSDSFTDALSAISEHVSPREGDTLEIGVNGFPPALYECVWMPERGTSDWLPSTRLAA